VADPTNHEISQALKRDYKLQCGTPWFVNADTGHNVCGYREKDVLEKWIKGEEIPQPPRPTGPPPRPPFHGAKKKEETAWKKEYAKWLKDNEHLPANQKKTAKEILEMPRPKSQPPSPPQPNSTDEQLESWKESYEKWATENDHLPNLQPADKLVEQFKKRDEMMRKQAEAGQAAQNSKAQFSGNMQHAKQVNTQYYYTVENGSRIEVYADEEYIRNLKQQYYVRLHGDGLTKVVDDIEYDKKRMARHEHYPQDASKPPVATKPTMKVSDEVKEAVKEAETTV